MWYHTAHQLPGVYPFQVKKKELQRLEEDDIIKKVAKPTDCSSKKKNRDVRICVDF